MKALPIETRLPLDCFIRRRPRQLCRGPRLLSGQPAGQLGRLHRWQHLHAAERRTGQTTLRFQSPFAQRHSDERRHRQFRRRRNRHVELPEFLSRRTFPSRIAQLGQMAENHVVGAPCGIMGSNRHHQRAARLPHAYPVSSGRSEGRSETASTRFRGHQFHGAAQRRGQPYGDTRIEPSWAGKSSTSFEPKLASPPLNYLTELSVEQFRAEHAKALPDEIVGSAFLNQHKTR